MYVCVHARNGIGWKSTIFDIQFGQRTVSMWGRSFGEFQIAQQQKHTHTHFTFIFDHFLNEIVVSYTKFFLKNIPKIGDKMKIGKKSIRYEKKSAVAAKREKEDGRAIITTTTTKIEFFSSI